MSNSSSTYFNNTFDTDPALTNRCIGSPGYSRLTFAPPSNPNVTRRCGHHGSTQLSTLSGCCGAGAQIDTLGSPGPCGYLCAYTGTLQEWASCINNDTSLVFCLNQEITNDYKVGSASRRIRGPSSSQGMRWTTAFLGMLVVIAMLLPTVSALPSASDALKMVTWSRRANRGCQTVLHQDPAYVNYEPFDAVENDRTDYKVFNLTSSNPQNVTSPTYTRPGQIDSSFDSQAGSVEQICKLLHPDANDTTCDTTQLKGIKTSYEYWTKNGTLSVLFAFKSVYECIDAQLGDCDIPGKVYNGTFCATRFANSTAPLSYWAPSSQTSFQYGD